MQQLEQTHVFTAALDILSFLLIRHACVYIYAISFIFYAMPPKAETFVLQSWCECLCIGRAQFYIVKVIAVCVVLSLFGIWVRHLRLDDEYCSTSACSLSYMVSSGWERVVGSFAFATISLIVVYAAVNEEVKRKHVFDSKEQCMRVFNFVHRQLARVGLLLVCIGFALMARCPINSDGESWGCPDRYHKAGFICAILGLIIYVFTTLRALAKGDRCEFLWAFVSGFILLAYACLICLYFDTNIKMKTQENTFTTITALIELVLLAFALTYLMAYSLYTQQINHNESKYLPVQTALRL